MDSGGRRSANQSLPTATAHTGAMMTAQARLVAMPLVPRFTVVGAIAAGLLGGLLGLVLGLNGYPPTAWFAVLEVGVPAAILGGLLGALAGLVAAFVRRTTRDS